MPPIDPNFLSNSFAQGAQLGFQYGPGAQEDRASVIRSRDAAAVFNYGEQAQEDRASVINARNEATDFNYGEGAETYRETQRLGLETQNQYQGLVNSAQELLNLKNKNDEAAFGQLKRDLTRTNTQGNLLAANRALKLAQLPATEMAQQQLFGKELELQLANADFAVTNAQLAQTQRLAETKKGISDANTQALASTQIERAAVEDAELADMLTKAEQLDNQPGADRYSAKLNVLELATTTRLDALKRLAPRIQRTLNQIPEGAIPPELAEKLRSVKSTVNYQAADAGLQETFGRAEAASAQGGLPEGDGAVFNAVKGTGISVVDPSTYKDFQIEPLGDGRIRFNNVSTGLKSGPLSPPQYEGSQLYHKIAETTTARRLNQENPVLAREAVMNQLKSMAARPLSDSGINALSKLTTNLPNVFRTPASQNQLGNIIADAQDDIISFNPLFQPGFLQLEEGNVISDFFTGRANEDALVKKLELNPSYKEQIRSAWANRKTGGLPIQVYEAHIDAMAKTAMVQEPAKYGAQVEPGLRQQRIKSLKANLRANWELPVLTNIPERVRRAAGITDVKDESDRGYITSTLLGIRQFFGGEGVEQYIDVKPVGEKGISPNVLPSKEEESAARFATFDTNAAFAQGFNP